MVGSKPLSYAHIALIEAEQGGGKSCTAVARIADDYFLHITAIKSPLGKVFDIAEVLAYDHMTREAKVKRKPDSEPQLIAIPENWDITSSTRIFTNFHLFGMKYARGTLSQLIEWLDADVIRDGRLTIDENYIGANAREGMTALAKAIEKYSMQIRKRHLFVDFLYPHQRMADWTVRGARTEHILCDYNEDTREITLTIRRRGLRKTKNITYWAPQYFKYYDTDERFQLPVSQVGRAIMGAR